MKIQKAGGSWRWITIEKHLWLFCKDIQSKVSLSLSLLCGWRMAMQLLEKEKDVGEAHFTHWGVFVSYTFLYTRKTAHLTWEHLIPLVPNTTTWCPMPEFWIVSKGLFSHSHSELKNNGKSVSLLKCQENVKHSAEAFWCLIRDNLNRFFLWVIWSDGRITHLINASMKQCNNKQEDKTVRQKTQKSLQAVTVVLL